MLELVDRLAGGASVRKDVEVQVLSRAPNSDYHDNPSFPNALDSELGEIIKQVIRYGGFFCYIL